MSVQRRLSLTFLVALAGLAANQVVYVWSVASRSAAMTELDNARSRELDLTVLHREVDNLRRQISLTTQIQAPRGSTVVAPDVRRAFERRLRVIAGIVSHLRELAVAPDNRLARITELEGLCRRLADQWKGYYDNLGHDEAIALTFLVQSESLVQEVLNQRIPELQREEHQSVERALADFGAVGRFTTSTTTAFFVMTLTLTIIVLQWFIRHLTQGLRELRSGVEQFTSMHMTHRIAVSSRDELGDLARAFNDMAEELSLTQAEHSRVNVDLAKSEVRYRSLVERSVFGIYRTDEHQRFHDVNPALVSMLGYSSPQVLLALDLSRDVYVNPGDHQRLLQTCRDTGVLSGFDLEWRRRDGAIITVRLSGSASDPAHPERGMDVIVEDVTERKALGEQLRHAQKMQAVGRLAGGVAHDFNNLLTVIKGHVEVMLDRLNSDHPLRRRVVEVQRAADRAAVVTSQLLAFSRRQVLEPRVIDVNVLIENMTTMIEPLLGEPISLVTELDPRLGCVKADPGQIEQVLMNLVVNARDAMPSGGKLSIRTINIEHRQGSRVSSAGSQSLDIEPGSYVLIAVSDTGIGMDAETRRQAFEPFFTTKDPAHGTGLGLSMVYGIVRQSGGDIAVVTEIGRGTSMMIYLPRVDSPAEPAREVALGRAPSGSETVLLVEDDAAVRELIQDSLIESGYHVLATGEAVEAERVCREFEGPISLFLTDVVLPEIGGPDLSRKLLQLRPEMAVLFISGYAPEVILQRGVGLGETALVHKPFSPDLLARKVREVLDRSHRR